MDVSPIRVGPHTERGHLHENIFPSDGKYSKSKAKVWVDLENTVRPFVLNGYHLGT